MLNTRSHAPELMDTDCRDYDDYRDCLRDLSRVNRATLTYGPTLRWLARAARGRPTLAVLDVAAGYGDMLRRIRRWAVRRGLDVRLEGVDLNPWSVTAARAATDDADRIAFRVGDVFDVDGEYDCIVTAQFTHHLDEPTLVRFLRWIDAHAARGWFISDLHRHWFPYYGFGALASVMGWHRFVRHDGRVSIARSFRRADWERALGLAGIDRAAVEITWHFPFRLCVGRLK